jgi:GxxExxY protein
MLHQELTEKIIGAFYSVNNSQGFGYLEKVYENSMAIELKLLGLKVERQKNLQVFYRGETVGDYFADLVVNDNVIVELKAGEAICKEHELQLINYLRATNIGIGLLMNFGKKAELKRKIFTNNKKNL